LCLYNADLFIECCILNTFISSIDIARNFINGISFGLNCAEDINKHKHICGIYNIRWFEIEKWRIALIKIIIMAIFLSLEVCIILLLKSIIKVIVMMMIFKHMFKIFFMSPLTLYIKSPPSLLNKGKNDAMKFLKIFSMYP
tara:strand:+ start:1540 stop:1962 length:423 start_codon:yes stop_codon:yes gene_type:complete